VVGDALHVRDDALHVRDDALHVRGRGCDKIDGIGKKEFLKLFKKYGNYNFGPN